MENVTVKQGNKKLLFANRICCFNREAVHIKYKFDEHSILPIIINFYENTEKPHYEAKLSGKDVVIDLYNFNNSLGTGPAEPIKLGSYKNKKIYLILYVFVIGNTPILDLNIYTEE